MSEPETAVFGENDVLLAECADGVRVVRAPPVAEFADDVTDWCGDFTTLSKDIITIKALGRTVCYRIRQPTTESWTRCVFVADKVYDDADAKEPVS